MNTFLELDFALMEDKIIKDSALIEDKIIKSNGSCELVQVFESYRWHQRIEIAVKHMPL